MHGAKKLNLKIFKVEVAYILNDLDEELFKKIFDHEFAALADKVINTISNEEKKITIDVVKNNNEKIYD